VSAFEDGVERAVTADERARFVLIRGLCDPAAIEKVEPGVETYRVKLAGVYHMVQLESQAANTPHGHPR
jgi:hypothetical protein